MIPKILLNVSKGIGAYGTCAVKVEGEVSAVNWPEHSSAFPSSPFSCK